MLAFVNKYGWSEPMQRQCDAEYKGKFKRINNSFKGKYQWQFSCAVEPKAWEDLSVTIFWVRYVYER